MTRQHIPGTRGPSATAGQGRRAVPNRLVLAALVAVVPVFTAAEETVVSYRIRGLFQPDRVDDLRRQVGSMPAGGANTSVEVVLVDADYETTVATFRYDDASPSFRNRKPEQVREHIDNLLRQVSRGGFSVRPLDMPPPGQLRIERIAVAGHDCKGCNYGLYRAVDAIDGVERAVASFKEGHVTVWIDPAKTGRDAIVAALRKKDVDVVEPDVSGGTAPKR